MLNRLFERDEERYERILEETPDTPRDTLAYYESEFYNVYEEHNLSERDLRQIQRWMDFSDTMPGRNWIVDIDPTVRLNEYQRGLIRRWMIDTENIPVDYESPQTLGYAIEDFFAGIWNRICELKYEHDLQVMLGEKEPSIIFWR